MLQMYYKQESKRQGSKWLYTSMLINKVQHSILPREQVKGPNGEYHQETKLW